MPNNNPTILITGGTGFAGSHLVEALLAIGSKNIHVTSYGSDLGFVASLIPKTNIHQINLTNFDGTKELLKKIKPQRIYHLAALAGVTASFDQLKKVINVNTEIQLSVLSAVKEIVPDARMLVIGSALEYMPQSRPLTETDVLGPVSPYGVSKVSQDMLAYSFHRQAKLDIVIARPFNHIGERQAPGFVVPDFCLQIARIEQGKQDKIMVGNLKSIRDFSDVKDMVKAYVLLMDKGKTGEFYNIGSGSGITIKALLDSLTALAQVDIPVEIDQNRYRPIDVPQVIADNSKISQLGWKPEIQLKDTLKRTLEYYRKRL